MNNHLDSQLSSHLDSQLLSLTEYSNKYRVSISTLRRYIKAGKLPFSLRQGKYFLEDKNLSGLQESDSVSRGKSLSGNFLKSPPEKPVNADSDERMLSNETEGPSSDRDLKTSDKNKPSSPDFDKETLNKKKLPELKNLTSSVKKSELNPSSFVEPEKKSLLDKVMDSQKDFLRQIELKEIKMARQQNQIMELNNLIAVLEKENKDLKSLLYQEKDMEEWLELK